MTFYLKQIQVVSSRLCMFLASPLPPHAYVKSRLLSEDGAPLASAGENVNIVTAIFSNIWSAYEKCGSIEYFLADQEV